MIYKFSWSDRFMWLKMTLVLKCTWNARPRVWGDHRQWRASPAGGCIIYVKSVFAQWAVSFSKGRPGPLISKLEYSADLRDLCFPNTLGLPWFRGWIRAADTPHTVYLQLFDLVLFTSHKHSWAAEHSSLEGLLPAKSRWRRKTGPSLFLCSRTRRFCAWDPSVPCKMLTARPDVHTVPQRDRGPPRWGWKQSKSWPQRNSYQVGMIFLSVPGLLLQYQVIPMYCVLFSVHFQFYHSKFVLAFPRWSRYCFLLVDLPGLWPVLIASSKIENLIWWFFSYLLCFSLKVNFTKASFTYNTM